MKKNILLFLTAISLVFFQEACKKATEDAVDCIFESLSVSVSATPDPSNVKKINFQVSYTGSNTVKAVEWTFGDGGSAAVNGTTTSHTYTSAGNFSVKAKVQIVKGSSSCTPEPVKNITVN